ncbi:MAG: hypothetical protein HQK53_06830 [Oligoflexia bacterium]|nr:hypothetical protein [Oligoflexia bacterium]
MFGQEGDVLSVFLSRVDLAILVLAELDNSNAEVILDQTAACVYKLLQNFGNK